MRFTQELTEFLRINKCIYTVRRFQYFGRQTVVQGIGICNQVPVREAVKTKEDLEQYLELSGFDTLEAWWKAVKAFNKNYVGTFYLYKITTGDANEN